MKRWLLEDLPFFVSGGAVGLIADGMGELALGCVVIIFTNSLIFRAGFRKSSRTLANPKEVEA